MFKDTTQLQGFGGVKLPKLKGEVEIKLHNPTTGKTEIHRGENMVTNAIYDIFASNYCGTLNYNALLPIYSKMFGGVLCFENTLNDSQPTAEDAKNDYFIPDESVNPITAHAGQSTVTSQADDPKRGSMSVGNMTVTDGTVKLAWEWGLTEGNGQISALALTHTDVGTGGTGSTSDAFTAISPNINASFGLVPTQKTLFIDNNGYGYNFTTSGTTLTISRFPVAYQRVGLVGQAYNYVSGAEVSDVVSTKTVTLGTSYGSYGCFVFDNTTNKLWLFYNTSQTTSVAVDTIDLSDWAQLPSTSTSTTWTTQTATGPMNQYGNNMTPVPLPFENGCVYLPKDNGSGVANGSVSAYLKVNVTNTALQTLYTITNSTTGPTTAFAPNATNKIVAGKNFVINNGVLYKCATASPDAISYHDSGAYHHNSMMLTTNPALVRPVFLTGRSPLYYTSVSKFYLATKYNLSSAVQKSAAQSMIITYTLSEQENT